MRRHGDEATVQRRHPLHVALEPRNLGVRPAAVVVERAEDRGEVLPLIYLKNLLSIRIGFQKELAKENVIHLSESFYK